MHADLSKHRLHFQNSCKYRYKQICKSGAALRDAASGTRAPEVLLKVGVEVGVRETDKRKKGRGA